MSKNIRFFFFTRVGSIQRQFTCGSAMYKQAYNMLDITLPQCSINMLNQWSRWTFSFTCQPLHGADIGLLLVSYYRLSCYRSLSIKLNQTAGGHLAREFNLAISGSDQQHRCTEEWVVMLNRCTGWWEASSVLCCLTLYSIWAKMNGILHRRGTRCPLECQECPSQIPSQHTRHLPTVPQCVYTYYRPRVCFYLQ